MNQFRRIEVGPGLHLKIRPVLTKHANWLFRLAMTHISLRHYLADWCPLCVLSFDGFYYVVYLVWFMLSTLVWKPRRLGGRGDFLVIFVYGWTAPVFQRLREPVVVQPTPNLMLHLIFALYMNTRTKYLSLSCLGYHGQCATPQT